MTTPLERAAVLGGGTMGLGIAQTLALAGVEVTLASSSPGRTQQALHQLARRTTTQVEAGLRPETAVTGLSRVHAAENAAHAVADVEIVFEAVPEDLELKAATFREVSRAAPADAVLSSNTSSLPIGSLAEAVDGPERFLGVHWFNPPEWIPGVEVVTSPATDAAVVERVCHVLDRLDKIPVVVGDSPGFVANRLQYALFTEALACVEEGVATPRQVDAAVRSCFGFRLPFFGPFEVADMAGLDVYTAVYAVLRARLGERFTPSALLSALVEEGKTGTKAEQGFYDYRGQDLQSSDVQRDRLYAELATLLKEQDVR